MLGKNALPCLCPAEASSSRCNLSFEPKKCLNTRPGRGDIWKLPCTWSSILYSVPSCCRLAPTKRLPELFPEFRGCPATPSRSTGEDGSGMVNKNAPCKRGSLDSPIDPLGEGHLRMGRKRSAQTPRQFDLLCVSGAPGHKTTVCYEKSFRMSLARSGVQTECNDPSHPAHSGSCGALAAVLAGCLQAGPLWMEARLASPHSNASR